jgi:hypothetical protein
MAHYHEDGSGSGFMAGWMAGLLAVMLAAIVLVVLVVAQPWDGDDSDTNFPIDVTVETDDGGGTTTP